MSKKKPTETGVARAASGGLARAVEGMLPEIRGLIEEARHRAVTAANLSMVTLYWNVGRIINTELQRAPGRADYGEDLLGTLAERLRLDYGPGFSRSNLQDMRRFHEAFEICQTVSGKSGGVTAPPRTRAIRAPNCQTLSGELEPRLLVNFQHHFHLNWSQYRLLLSQGDFTRRRFYFEQAAAQRWSVRQLQRQITGALFERVALSKDTRALVQLEKRKELPEEAPYREAFKDPYLLDFLGLTGAYSEKDLEAAILANLQEFLTELGSDFCYVGSEYPLQVGGQDFALDLLFFHRSLNCLLAIELKVTAFQPEHLGKLSFYLEALDRDHRKPHENPAIGVLLCASKDDEVVEYALSRSLSPALIAEYQTQLPDKKMLQAKLHEFYALNISAGE